jgi:DNA-binding transcriptional MerR regulator
MGETNSGLPEVPAPGEEPNGFDPMAWFEQAGIDPEKVDPRFAGQGVQFYQQLNHRDYADRVVEHTLRQRGYLPEGMSLEDLQEAIAAHHQDGDDDGDPWAEFEPSGDDTGGYDDQEEYVPYGEPQQPAFDPRQLRPVIESEVERAKREALEEFERRQQEQRQEQQMRAALERLQAGGGDGEPGLPYQAALGVLIQANEMASTNPTASFEERLAAAEKAFREEDAKRLAELAKRQAEVNRQNPGIPAGPPPTDEVPMSMSLEEFKEQETRRLGAQGL